MIDVGQEFFDIVGAECHVSFAKEYQIPILLQGFLEGPKYALAIACLRFGHDSRACLERDLEGIIGTIVVDHNDAANAGMASKICNSSSDTFCIVVTSERNNYLPIDNRRQRLSQTASTLRRKEQRKVQRNENNSDRRRNTAVPHDCHIPGSERIP